MHCVIVDSSLTWATVRTVSYKSAVWNSLRERQVPVAGTVPMALDRLRARLRARLPQIIRIRSHRLIRRPGRAVANPLQDLLGHRDGIGDRRFERRRRLRAELSKLSRNQNACPDPDRSFAAFVNGATYQVRFYFAVEAFRLNSHGAVSYSLLPAELSDCFRQTLPDGSP